MKTRYLISILGLLLIGCADTVLAQETNKPPSADNMSAKIVGVWKRNSQHPDTSFEFVDTYRAGGVYTERSTRIFKGKATITNNSGKWEVKDGVLITTEIYSDAGTPGTMHALHHAIVSGRKIVRVDGQEMVLQNTSSIGKALGAEVFKRQD
jgi:hypothetical protein